MNQDQQIAIVGLALRLPGDCRDLGGFWQVLYQGKNLAQEVPASRWSKAWYGGAQPVAGKTRTHRATFLSQLDQFDAGYFGMSDEDADALDPMHRLLLELSIEALEDAGLPEHQASGRRLGVFAGLASMDYALLSMADADTAGAYTTSNTKHYMGPNRVSHYLDARGPSVAVDAACATSLLAVHLACQSLKAGECEVALVGSANVLLSPMASVSFSQLGVLSPDGKCKPFDESADGYGRAEGAVVLVLKPLSAALAAQDQIHAVIRGTGTCHGGRPPLGWSAPRAEQQAALLREVLAQARMSPEEISYFEAHGTGTQVGDVQETLALGEVFGAAHRARGGLPVGSVKSSFNHGETVAGITGLLKAVAVVQQRMLPPTPIATAPRKAIDFAGLGLRLPSRPEPLAGASGPLAVAVSSFGVGGSYANAIVQEPPKGAALPPRAARPRPALVPLSAKSPGALAATAAALAEELSAGPRAAPALEDVAFTLGARRSHHPWRTFAVAEDAADLGRQLAAPPVAPAPAAPRGLFFVFSGMGPQWWGMGRELLEREPAFRAALEAYDEKWTPHAGWSVLEELRRPEATSRVGPSVVHSMAANIALQVGLFHLWTHWGITPTGVLGHSVGELAAAYASGALSLPDLARIAAARCAWTGLVDGAGTMAAVGLSAAEVLPWIAEHAPEVDLAASNAPDSVTVAGPAVAIERLAAAMEAKGTFCKALKVTVPFHSRALRQRRAEFELSAPRLDPVEPKIPLISSVTGAPFSGRLDASYWLQNFVEPVRFMDAIKAAARTGEAVFLEVGPHPVLGVSIEATLRQASPQSTPAVLHTLHRKSPEQHSALTALGQLYQQGFLPDWSRAGAEGGRPTRLPLHRWQHKRHWNESQLSRARRLKPEAHPLLGHPVQDPAAPTTATFDNLLSLELLPYLESHKVDGQVVMPGAAYVELMRAAAAHQLGAEAVELSGIGFEQVLTLSRERPVCLRTVASALSGTVALYSAPLGASGEPESAWVRHASASFALLTGAAPTLSRPGPGEGGQKTAAAEFYSARWRNGLQFGEDFQTLRELYTGEGVVTATLELGGLGREASARTVLALDGAFQAAGASQPSRYRETLLLPWRIAKVRFWGDLGQAATVHGSTSEAHFQSVHGEVAIASAAGAVLAQVKGLERQALRRPGGLSWAPEDALFVEALLEQAPPAPAAEPRPRRVAVLGGEHGPRGLRAVVGRGAQDCAVLSRPDEVSAWLAHHLEHHPGVEAQLVDLRWLEQGAALAEAPFPAAQAWAAMETLKALCGSPLANQEAALRWVMVTRRQGGAGALPSPAFSALVALERVAQSEYPRLGVQVLEVQDELEGPLGAELAAPVDERELTWRGGQRSCLRVRPLSEKLALVGAAAAPSPDEVHQLGLAGPAEARTLAWHRSRRRALAPREVRVGVRYASLNFRDAMKRLGIYPADSNDPDAVGLGDECSGLVLEVGAQVRGVAPGDLVIVRASGSCLATELTVDQGQVFAKPAGLTEADAACVPVVFATAWYALRTLAHLSPKERVLIHSGAGGVGLAAIQIAKLCGAEVFATAGTAEKRRHLEALGVRAAFDSKDVRFAREVLEATAGEGVDVVLNSLAGPAMAQSFSTLRHFGRFLELGKRDLFDNTQVGLYALRNNLSYHAVDLAKVWRLKPELGRAVLGEVLEAFGRGALQPLPSTTFQVSAVQRAFEHLADKERVGKTVVDLRQAASAPLPIAAPRGRGLRRAVRDGGTHLVTGGLGAFGLIVCRWLADAGARHLAIVSRSGADTPEKKAALEELRARGVEVELFRGSAAQRPFLEDTLARLDARGRALRGVFHLAGVLKDSPISSLTPGDVEAVIAPKVEGAWNLHQLTRGRPLEYFVLFSSASVMVGAAGQAAYGMANASLDWLARARWAMGLPALSIGWGALLGGGMVSSRVLAQMDAQGVSGFTPKEAFAMLDAVVPEDLAHLYLRRVDWKKYLAAAERVPPRLRDFAVEREDEAQDVALADRIRTAKSAQADALILEYLRAQLAKTTGAPLAAVGADQKLVALALDSLATVSLSNRIANDLGVTPDLRVWKSEATVGQMARGLRAQVAGAQGEDEAERQPGEASQPAVADARFEIAATPGSREREELPLSYIEERQYRWWQQSDAQMTGRVAWRAAWVDGPFSASALRQAVDRLLARHDILRSHLSVRGEAVVRRVPAKVETPLRQISLERRAEPDAAALAELGADAHRPFELTREPPLRVGLAQVGPRRHLLYLVADHIAMDAEAFRLMWGELKQLYGAAASGKDPGPGAPVLQYGDFALWQRRTFGDEGLVAAERAFWTRRLEGAEPINRLLPTDFPRSHVDEVRAERYLAGFRIGRAGWRGPPGLAELLKRVAATQRATLFAASFAAFGAVLGRYAGTREVVLSSINDNRRRAAGLQGVVGPFLNPTLLKVQLGPAPTWAELIGATQAELNEVFSRVELPLIPLLYPRLNDYFRVVFNFIPEDATHEPADWPGCRASPIGRDQVPRPGRSHVDLVLLPHDGTLDGSLDYNAELFSPKTAQRLIDDYLEVLQAMATAPGAQVR